jgi:putative SOS response-associated peptidase YedK
MCGRFTLRTPATELVEPFELAMTPALEPRYNIAPTQPIAVVRLAPDNTKRELVLVRWGLIPSWAADPSIGARMINARADSIATKPAFRSAARRRRCLIPADGFYEWKAAGKTKQPYYITQTSQMPFAFAGLWERWQAPGRDVIESCVIITTDANDRLRELHNRMPVILDRDRHAEWLDPTIDRAEQLLPLLRPYPSEKMGYRAVSRFVNNARNEGPACIEPVAV